MNKREEAMRLRLEGLTYSAIAEQVGLSRQRVQQITSPPKAVRRHVVALAEGQCAGCGIYVGKSGHVHHLGIGEDYNDLVNLVLLCPSCHRKAHLTNTGDPASGVHITLPEDTFAQLTQKATEEGTTVGRLVRILVLEAISQRQARLRSLEAAYRKAEKGAAIER